MHEFATKTKFSVKEISSKFIHSDVCDIKIINVAQVDGRFCKAIDKMQFKLIRKLNLRGSMCQYKEWNIVLRACIMQVCKDLKKPFAEESTEKDHNVEKINSIVIVINGLCSEKELASYQKEFAVLKKQMEK